MKRFLRELLITLGMALVIYLILQMVIQSSIVNNISMEPTLIAGQRLIAVKATYRFKQPQRGDIIIIHPPIEPDKEYVRRLIGLPSRLTWCLITITLSSAIIETIATIPIRTGP